MLVIKYFVCILVWQPYFIHYIIEELQSAFYVVHIVFNAVIKI